MPGSHRILSLGGGEGKLRLCGLWACSQDPQKMFEKNIFGTLEGELMMWTLMKCLTFLNTCRPERD